MLQKSFPIDGGAKPFRFQPHWFEENELMESFHSWWDDSNVTYKKLKNKIKQWVCARLEKIEHKFFSIKGALFIGNVIKRTYY